MPRERFGQNHPVLDAARVRSFQDYSAASDTSGLANLIAGADININGNIISRSGNVILLYDSGGAILNEYPATQAGLAAAQTAWTSGDTILLPSITIACTSGITVAQTIKGMGFISSVLSFSGFSGVAVTLSSGGYLEDLAITFNGTGQTTATGVSSLGTTLATKIINCYISVSSATNNFGVRLSGTAIYNGPQIDKSFVDTVNGTDNVSYELGNYSFASYCYGGSKSGATSNVVIDFVGTQATIGTPLANHCYFFGGNVSVGSWGGRVSTNKTGRATHCYFEGATGGMLIQSGATLSAYADHWNTLSNSGALIHLPGDLSGGGGGAAVSDWFNVEDYGADPSGTADSTTAIQAAINAADAANGGTIWFPTPGGIYKVAGALQDTSHANAQLLLPSRGLGDGEITIRFKGPETPSLMWNTVSAMPAQTGGVATIKGTLTGQTGTACMIGAYGPAVGGIFAGADYITVIFEDLMIELPPNPSYTALDCSNFGAGFRGVQVHCGEWNVATMTQPTATNAYGVKMTKNDLQGYEHAQGLAVFGFYYGIRLTEFGNLDGLRCVGCIYPYVIPFLNHPIIIQSAGFYDCPHGVLSDGSGDARLTIQNLDIEHANHGTSPAWQWTSSDLDDSGNNLYGFIQWISVQGGVGNDHTFVKNGGTHLQTIEIDTFLGTGSGTVTSVATGTGLTGGPITTTGTIALANTTVTLGTYGDAANIPQITIDQQGRITSAANVAISTLTPINVYNETLIADGVSLSYYLTNYAAPGTIRVWIDGIRQPASDDIAPTDIVTFTSAPSLGALLLFDYEMDQS